MKKNAAALSYEQAFAEMQQILQALQNEQVSMDDLPEKLARAHALIAFCRERLRLAESEIERLVEA